MIARRLLPALLALPALARAQPSETVQTGRGPVRVSVWADGLDRPWGGGFLPDGRLLLSERPGRVRLVSAGGQVSAPLGGVPAVEFSGQGGLLDISPAPDFATTREVFFVTAALVQGGALTRLWRARLGTDALEDARTVLDATPAQPRGRLHYGGRLAFSPDGRHIFLTTGERNEVKERAQSLTDLAGKVLRLTREGEIPRDNPFVGRTDARAEIWSYGHRNPQGIAFHPVTGSLFAVEFGPLGGDELNLIRPGLNYGWPRVTLGLDYSGAPIAGAVAQRPGMVDPAKNWTPAISPSGFAFAPPEGFWRGDAFLACQNPPGLLRLPMNGDVPGQEERLLWGKLRMRQVIFAPDGALLILTDERDGQILRVTSLAA